LVGDAYHQAPSASKHSLIQAPPGGTALTARRTRDPDPLRIASRLAGEPRCQAPH